jgi:hypothetical protein
MSEGVKTIRAALLASATAAPAATATEPTAKPRRQPSYLQLKKEREERKSGKGKKSKSGKPAKPRFRGRPPPLAFDIDTLPASTLLTAYETAAAVRRPLPTLEAWRLNPNHPLRWRKVAGRPLYELSSIREFLKGTK